MSDSRNLIAFLFPLEDGAVANLYMPTKLTKDELQRLHKMIDSLWADNAGPTQSQEGK